ncbi:MAG: proton-conducting transporter transmembrane domain-containing protein [bacterium]
MYFLYYYLFLFFSIAGIIISFSGMISKKFSKAYIAGNILYMAASLFAVISALSFFVKPVAHFANYYNNTGGANNDVLFSIGKYFPAGNILMCLDPLSAFFILFSFAVFFYISLYQIKYIEKFKEKINPSNFTFLFGIMLLSVYFTLLSFNAFIFMISWEVMAVSSYLLVLGKHYIKGTVKASFLMSTIMEFGGMFIMAAIMLLYVHSGNFNLFDMKDIIISPALKEVIFLLFLFGFGAKIGIVPLHIWLPEAHPASLSGVSAILSGVLTSAGIYGLMRFGLYILHPVNTALFLGTVVIIIAALTMFFGVLYMAQTHDLKVLLSYSTVENMGLILTGIGASLYYRYFNLDGLAALALLASLYALINHAFFKSLLFMSAGNIEYQTDSHDMDKFGGLLHAMPLTGVLAFIGVMAAAAMPPLNGFVSEWLNIEVVFLGFNIHSVLPRIVLFSAGAILALSAAMAIGNYVKLYGITFLSSARSKKAMKAKEVPLLMNIAILIPVLLSISLSAFMFFYTPFMSEVSNLIYHINISDKIMHNFIFIPYYNTFSASSPVYLFFVSIILIIILYLIYRFIVKPKKRYVKLAWIGGTESLNPHAQISALGFSNAIRIMFNIVYKSRKRIEARKIRILSNGEEMPMPAGKESYVLKTHTKTQNLSKNEENIDDFTKSDGNIPNPFPYSSFYHDSSGYGSYIFPLLEYYLYLPVIKFFNRLSNIFSKLQNGSLNLYIFYIFIVFLTALIVVR